MPAAPDATHTPDVTRTPAAPVATRAPDVPVAPRTPAEPIDHDAARRLWAAYGAATGAVHDQTYEADTFGDSLELANSLLAAVTHGTKRATSSLLADFEAAGEAPPVIGAHWVACDGHGVPRAILRTTELRVARFAEVDGRFARDEGEDDGSLASWRREHRRYFERTCAARGATFAETDELLLERFTLVWPPAIADAADAADIGDTAEIGDAADLEDATGA
ncbi:ASCH domain-containing protein [Pseudactinotalea sp. HY160]|uniref:ASCH domain-containing protein n=1 Tax=Pseudactinotalea sp. HY160 TaxID=2654490 RepID=UPI00128CDA2C|nr:ASCH domain-containing protein [Pseudactinotalea sp. HY160]MPV49163.1 ASCH domain-containing protein [Pseudactinotalea sp. HY160]